MFRLATSLLVLTAALTACGGGDSTTAAPATPPSTPTPPNARITLSPASLNITQPVTSYSIQTQRIDVTFTPGANALLRYTTNAIGSLQDIWDTAAGGLKLDVRYKPAYSLPPGTYDDSIRIDICTDSNCTAFVPGTTAIVTVRMTVTSVAGVSMSVASTNISYEAKITDGEIPGRSNIEIRFAQNTLLPTLKVTTTGNTVFNSSIYSSSESSAFLQLSMRTPPELGVGDFTDTVTVTACLDPQCVNPLPQSPLTLQIHTRITDTVPGANGYRAEILRVHGYDLAWDAQRSLLYVSSPDPTYDSTGQSRIVSIAADPARTTSQVVVPWKPGPIALSTDRQYLYAGTVSSDNSVRRLDLPSMAVSQSIDLGSTADGPRHAREMRTAPGASGALAIARTYNPVGAVSAGVVIQDGLVARPNVVGEPPDPQNGPTIDHITWGADASRLFASSDSTGSPELYEISASAQGAQLLRRANARARGSLYYWAGALYSGDGGIFDPATLAEIGRFVAPDDDGPAGNLMTLIDGPRNRAYVVVYYPQRPGTFESGQRKSVVSFNLAQRTPIASATLNALLHYRDIELFGNDGIALLSEDILPTDGKITLLTGAFVQP
jgi:hypothetical protein